MSLVIIFPKNILALLEAVGLTVSQIFSQSRFNFSSKANGAALPLLPCCYIHQELLPWWFFTFFDICLG